MGSASDWPTMEHAARTLEDFGVSWEAEVVSAHRTPDKLFAYATSARGRGLQCVIAGAGGAAHLPGMTAALTDLPVLGVPVETKALKGIDSLLSIVQMPAGIPTATFAIGKAGAVNAALFAVTMLALLGDLWPGGDAPDWCPLFADGEASLHLYGKTGATPRRKMGHVNLLGTTAQDALQRACRLKQQWLAARSTQTDVANRQP